MSLSSGDNPAFGQTALSTAAAQLANQPCSAALLQNDPGNSVNILIGNASHQYFQLQPGQSVTIPCSNLNQIYAVAASATPNLNWFTVS